MRARAPQLFFSERDLLAAYNAARAAAFRGFHCHHPGAEERVPLVLESADAYVARRLREEVSQSRGASHSR